VPTWQFSDRYGYSTVTGIGGYTSANYGLQIHICNHQALGFMALHPTVYAKLLQIHICNHQALGAPTWRRRRQDSFDPRAGQCYNLVAN
jgi:hypothetical protein